MRLIHRQVSLAWYALISWRSTILLRVSVAKLARVQPAIRTMSIYYMGLTMLVQDGQET